MNKIVLASYFSYHVPLLEKLKIPFGYLVPDINEPPLAGETAAQIVQRLACAKAQKLANQISPHLKISSDQYCVLRARSRASR